MIIGMSAYQKSNLISVDEAVAKGRKMLLLPRMLLIIGLFCGLFPIGLILIAVVEGPVFTKNIWLIAGSVVFISILVFLFLPFLYWSKRTTSWKLWAFDNVDDVHELKIVALQANLFPLYGSVMDRLQIQSAYEREQWKKLQERFHFHGDFIDDSGLPAETRICFSKLQLSLNMLLGLFFVGIGVTVVILSFHKKSAIWPKIVGVVIALAPWYMIIATFKDLLNRKPQLVLSDTGIYTEGSGPIPWDAIYDIEVKQITQGRRGIKYTLHFKYPGGFVNINVTELDISRNKLEKLIRVYRGRSGFGRSM